jgi:hypothetical protein
LSGDVPHTCPAAQSALLPQVQTPAGLHLDAGDGQSPSRVHFWGTACCMRAGQVDASSCHEHGASSPQLSAHPGRPHQGTKNVPGGATGSNVPLTGAISTATLKPSTMLTS